MPQSRRQWRNHRREREIVWATTTALLVAGFQGWLGGWVVASQLAPWMVTIHLIFALAIVQLLLYPTLRASGTVSWPPFRPALALVTPTMVQIGIGTQVRGAMATYVGA